MEITIGRAAFLRGDPKTLERIAEALRFPNPKYAENERLGFSNWQVEPWIDGAEWVGQDSVVIARGAVGLAIYLTKQAGESYRIIDHRRSLPEVWFTFMGQLRDYQQEAVEAILRREFGVLQAPTGSGKTTMALAVIAARRQPALIVVHTKELAAQWRERAVSFLGMQPDEIGQVGGGKSRIGNRLTIALVQSLYERADEVAERIGFLVIDECHHCPSRTFTEAVSAFDCRYMMGLTATPYRRDGLGRLINWYIGPTVHQIDQQALVDNGSLVQAEVIPIETGFRTETDCSEYYSRAISTLVQDKGRNRLIVETIRAEADRTTGIVLVLSDRKQHCHELRRMLAADGIEAEVLVGDMPSRERADVVKQMQADETRIVIGTGSLLGEGFDCPAVESLMIATPIKYWGRLAQFVGRALRPSSGKTAARIIDFQDNRNPVLRAGAMARLRAYRQMAGVRIMAAN